MYAFSAYFAIDLAKLLAEIISFLASFEVTLIYNFLMKYFNKSKTIIFDT
jgi:hypothetical protein